MNRTYNQKNIIVLVSLLNFLFVFGILARIDMGSFDIVHEGKALTVSFKNAAPLLLEAFQTTLFAPLTVLPALLWGAALFVPVLAIMVGLIFFVDAVLSKIKALNQNQDYIVFTIALVLSTTTALLAFLAMIKMFPNG